MLKAFGRYSTILSISALGSTILYYSNLTKSTIMERAPVFFVSHGGKIYHIIYMRRRFFLLNNKVPLSKLQFLTQVLIYCKTKKDQVNFTPGLVNT